MLKFVPRQRKHKARRRAEENAEKSSTTERDSNIAEILPAHRIEREKRKQAEKERLRAEGVKISGKKKKRLDKYLETKLKREENQELIRKLSAQQIDTSLLQSTKTLGRGRETKNEKLERAVKEVRAGYDIAQNREILLERRGNQDIDEAGTVSDTSEGSDTNEARSQTEEASKGFSQKEVTFGSGLKRPLEVDELGRPIIKKRKRSKGSISVLKAHSIEPEFEGFSTDSEDSDSITPDSQVDPSLSEEEYSDSTSQEESESAESLGGESRERRTEIKNRTSAFKEWATKQRNEAIGFVPSSNITELASQLKDGATPNFTPRAPETDPLPYELRVQSSNLARKAHAVAVKRTEKMQQIRLELPVAAEEQKIMEAIHNNDVVIIHGPTGSGKTTQVPQFLFEAGYGSPDGPTPGMIGVTQPRRVAAVSMSRRVGDELGDAGSKVAYQIRFDTSVSDKTSVKFMTDGVLLREVSHDFILSKYSAIIIDEAHERSVNTDILIGMLSRIVPLRAKLTKENPPGLYNPLKLIIMSATMRITDFADNRLLFRNKPPPIVQLEGRQYPVTAHFARKTKPDYVEEAFVKVSRGHKKLPKGAMLVFLTGQNEITELERRLKQAFQSTSTAAVRAPPVRISAADESLETEDIDLGSKDNHSDDFSDDDSEIRGLDESEDEEFDIGEPVDDLPLKVHVLPLYSQLPSSQQMRVFEDPPEGSRLIVIATNVAETSLTIPGVKYVFDCGRSKERRYDPVTGVQRFEVGWISKASASQREGRAGRTGPGHCYRLYSSAVYERDFGQFDSPEIERTPIEGVVLQLKSMEIANVANFPFPTIPNKEHLRQAERLLGYLGALDDDGKVTSLGRELSLYPLNPRFARILESGVSQNQAEQAIALAAALSVPEIFIPENRLNLKQEKNQDDQEYIRTEQDNIDIKDNEQTRKDRRRAHAKLSKNESSSDAVKLFYAVCAYANESSPGDFCEKHYIREKALKEATQLRAQLHSIVSHHRPTVAAIKFKLQLLEPSKRELIILRQICASGFIDQIAIRADLHPSPPPFELHKPKRGQEVPYLPLFPLEGRYAGGPFVYIHPSSVLASSEPKKAPLFIVYARLQRSSPKFASEDLSQVKTRVLMHPLTPLTRPELANLAKRTPLLQYGKPVVGGKFQTLERKEGKERRECEVELSLRGSAGAIGWPLGRRIVIQQRDPVKGWIVEEVP